MVAVRCSSPSLSSGNLGGNLGESRGISAAQLAQPPIEDIEGEAEPCAVEQRDGGRESAGDGARVERQAIASMPPAFITPVSVAGDSSDRSERIKGG